jgi:hypothetical protein
VTYFNLQRYLKHHYLPMVVEKSAEPATPKPVKKVVAKEAPAPVAAPAPVEPVKVVKKVLVKKKTEQLTEER